jgi:guanylate kinase
MNLDLKKSFLPNHTEPLLVVISGPSGVGKDTVVDRMAARNLPFHFVVTATTRLPREDEVNGVDYFFYTKDKFAEMIGQDELLEYAVVYNEFKGIPKAQVMEALASGKDVVMRLDVQGAATIRKLFPDALLIFLTTETPQELENRLKARKTEDPEAMKLRIATAHEEVKRVVEFDYVVENRDSRLDETVDIIKAIITAEHHRVKPRKVII